MEYHEERYRRLKHNRIAHAVSRVKKSQEERNLSLKADSCCIRFHESQGERNLSLGNGQIVQELKLFPESMKLKKREIQECKLVAYLIPFPSLKNLKKREIHDWNLIE